MSRMYCIFSIGPVQAFIAASRKLEDLWGGSYLLSYLIKKAIVNIETECEQKGVHYQPIYPYFSQELDTNHYSLAVANYPNRITFTLDLSQEQAKIFLEIIENKLRNELKRVADWAVEEVFNRGYPEDKARVAILQEQARDQVDSFLEVNWIAYPIQGECSKEYRLEAERLFHGLKSQRLLKPDAETGIACTVYQRMDALCLDKPSPEDSYAGLMTKLNLTWSNRNERFKPQHKDDEDNARIRNNEYLCAISLVRRVARDFFRTELNCDDTVFAKYETVMSLGDDGDAYYAVLLMDGDDMGVFFNRGEHEVRNISQKLGYFAGQVVHKIVKEHNGVLLYAGGDDVLALFPVQTVLEAAQQLRCAFSDEAKGLSGATASAGIAIGHKRTPLQQMLNEARTLERQAKSYRKSPGSLKPDKDAMGLSVLPRSGEYLGPVVLPWRWEHREIPLELKQFTGILKSLFSPSFIYHFASTFQRIAPISSNDHLAEMVEQECLRLMERSLREGHDWKAVNKSLPEIKTYYAILRLEGLMDLFKILAFFNRRERRNERADANTG